MIRRPPRSTRVRSSAASDVYKRQSVTQSGDDRVAISGVTGSAPPDTTKVCLNTLGGFRNSVEFILTGLDIDAKAALINAQMEEALVALDIGPDSIEWQ